MSQHSGKRKKSRKEKKSKKDKADKAEKAEKKEKKSKKHKKKKKKKNHSDSSSSNSSSTSEASSDWSIGDRNYDYGTADRISDASDQWEGRSAELYDSDNPPEYPLNTYHIGSKPRILILEDFDDNGDIV